MFHRRRHHEVAGSSGPSGTADTRGERSAPGPACPTCGAELVDLRCPNAAHPSHFGPRGRPPRSLAWAINELDASIWHVSEVAEENGRADVVKALHDFRLAFLEVRRQARTGPVDAEERATA